MLWLDLIDFIYLFVGVLVGYLVSYAINKDLHVDSCSECDYREFVEELIEYAER